MHYNQDCDAHIDPAMPELLVQNVWESKSYFIEIIAYLLQKLIG